MPSVSRSAAPVHAGAEPGVEGPLPKLKILVPWRGQDHRTASHFDLEDKLRSQLQDAGVMRCRNVEEIVLAKRVRPRIQIPAVARGGTPWESLWAR
jgi:hypothetical protein